MRRRCRARTTPRMLVGGHDRTPPRASSPADQNTRAPTYSASDTTLQAVNRAVALAKRTDDAGRFTHRTRDRFLAQFLHSNGIADAPSLVRSLATLDGATLREQVRRAANDFGWSIDACGYVFRTMERAASNPAVDHDGSFARVHHAIPRAWVCAHGGSWLLEQPVGLLRLCQSLSESDARHVLDMARALTEDRVIASSLTAVARDRVRVVGSASQRLRRVVQVVRCVGLLHDTPVAELLRRDADPNHLVDVVARGMAYLNRHVAGRSGVHTTKVRTQAEMFLLHVQMLVRRVLLKRGGGGSTAIPPPLYEMHFPHKMALFVLNVRFSCMDLHIRCGIDISQIRVQKP